MGLYHSLLNIIIDHDIHISLRFSIISAETLGVFLGSSPTLKR